MSISGSGVAAAAVPGSGTEPSLSLPAGRSWLLPLVGFVAAVVAIILRRPDAVTHAQFFAEDGTYYFSNAFNHGLWVSLTVPQAGYFQEYAVVAASAARLAPLAHAPLAMNLFGIAAQALPVPMLLSRRSQSFAPDVRVRVLLCVLYIAIPDAAEVDASAVNAQWHLIVAALIIVLWPAPQTRRAQVFEGAVLLASGLSGPFCILLAPLAWLLGRRDARLRCIWRVVLLAGCAAVQLLSLLWISHIARPGLSIEARQHYYLGASAGRLVRLLAGKTLLPPLVGETAALNGSALVFWAVSIAGAIAFAFVVARGPDTLRLVALFAAALLVVSLVFPLAPAPAWEHLGEPGAGDRYFLIPQLAALAALAWVAFAGRWRPLRAAAVVLLVVAVLVGIPAGWSYPALPTTSAASYEQQARVFDHAPRGTSATFALAPPPWTMTLTKR